MIGIVDYGAGNIRSVVNALDRLGLRPFVSADSRELAGAEKLIFPGVGEAKSAMDSLVRANLVEWLKEVTVPFLGICLGMELLFERTTERNTSCLAIVPGTIDRFDDTQPALKVPHIGWNQVLHDIECPLFEGIASGEYFYFVHSYYAPVVSETVGLTEYGGKFTSAVRKQNYYGVQFHPEKSGKAGLRMLKNFVELC
jgi:glutamine amidotransferase